MTLTKFPTPNFNDLGGLFTYANSVTGNLFGLIIPVSLAVIVFLATSNFPKERSFALASLTALFSSTMLHTAGIPSSQVIIVSVIASILSLYLLHKSTSSSQF